MLKCLVIDDEPLAVDLVSDYVNQTDGLELAGSFTNPIEGMQALDSLKPDIIFLDVQMPEITGIQFMKIVKGKYHIIMVTAYDNYAVEGFEQDAVDYLLKPISYERFLVSIEKIKSRNAVPSNTNNPSSPTASKDYIFVKSEYKVQKINVKEIQYIQSHGDYAMIHTPDERIMTLEKLKSFESRLAPNDFVRVHKSYIVSISKINFIERNRIVINEQYIPIGSTYKDKFWELIQGS